MNIGRGEVGEEEDMEVKIVSVYGWVDMEWRYELK